MTHKKANQQRPTPEYFKVVRGKDGDTPELFLYGYIGQKAWWDEDPENDITDIAVVKAIRELEAEGSKRINIRINSPGGSVMHGDPIITAIRNSKVDIHTYVDGIAASMAFDIWISGKKRHVAINSKLMTHATATIAMGTARDMEKAAEMLRKFDESAIATFAAVTGMSEDETRERFYDYEDHWLTAKEAKELGLIDEIDNYETAQVTENPEKMTFRQLLSIAARVEMPAQEKEEPEPEQENEFEMENWRVDYLRRLKQL